MSKIHNIFKTLPIQTHLLLLRFMTLSFCMSPISSGKDSSLLECRNSTVTFFQLPICDGKESKKRLMWANSQATPFEMSTTTHTNRTVHANLRGKLHKEVVICSKGADVHTLADGRRQGFNLIETAVQFIQRCQPDIWHGVFIINIYCI